MSSPSNDTRSRGHQLSSYAWPVAVVICVVTLIIVLGRVLQGCTPGGIAAAFKPEFRISYRTAISTSIDKMQRTGKLVVLQSEVGVVVTEESSKVVTVLGHPIDVGTTSVQIRCGGNKIQYYMPLDHITSDTFKFDKVSQHLVVTVPEPILDTDIVDIQSDPTQIDIQTKVGWGRLDAYSGQALRQLARTHLRPAVIAEGRGSIHLEAAKQQAKHQLQQMLTPLVNQLQDRVELVVEFK